MLNEITTNSDDSVINSEININIDADVYMEFARKFHEQYLIKGRKSDLDNAVDNYIDAIKYNPNIPEAYYRLASLLWDKGEINLNSAIEQCKSAINISPSDYNARIYAAYFLEMAKKYEEAEQELKAAIKLNPLKSARSRLTLASMYLDKMNDNKINIKDLSQSLYYMFSGGLSIALDYPSIKMLYKNLSKNVSVLFYDLIGQLSEKTKNYSLAIKAYDNAANKTGKNEIFYKKIGDINIKEDDLSKARDAYLKALQTNPNEKELLYKVAAITQLHFEDEIDIAIDCYTKLLELDNNAFIYYELGHLYLKKNDMLNSLNAFNLAIEKDYENPFYHNAIAYTLVKLEQYEEAAEHYKFAINKNPEPEWTSIVCQTLASLYYSAFEDVDGALDLLKTAIILDGSNSDAYVDIGDIYSDCEDIDSAIKAYCEAIKLNPKNPSVYNKCAMALWQKNYIEEAIIAYHKAIGLNPDYYNAYNNLGVIYLDGICNLKEAKKLFEKAIELKDDYVMAYFNLGRTLQRLGKNLDAAKCYQTALELNEYNQEMDSEEINKNLHSLFEV